MTVIDLLDRAEAARRNGGAVVVLSLAEAAKLAGDALKLNVPPALRDRGPVRFDKFEG